MTNRERIKAIMNYEKVDRIPVVAFGYIREVLTKWADEGYITKDEAEDARRNGETSEGGMSISAKVGFDFHWGVQCTPTTTLYPEFERKVLETRPNGLLIVQNESGHIVSEKPDIKCIPGEIGTLLEDRESWEKLYLPKLQYSDDRVDIGAIKSQVDYLQAHDQPVSIWAGSLYGQIRDMLGVEGLAYLAVDDEELYEEIINTYAELDYKVLEHTLDEADKLGIKFDYAHMWEDICFKNGPLVRPETFARLVGPHYKKVTDLLHAHGITTVSLDCDGCIDLLVPIWLENGVNTMFPMEVGTWKASIAPWREKYGKSLRGVGGMDKRVFAMDKAAVDKEIERLKPLVDMGGYIPCVDHRVPPNAEFELVQYYCDKFRKTFTY